MPDSSRFGRLRPEFYIRPLRPEEISPQGAQRVQPRPPEFRGNDGEERYADRMGRPVMRSERPPLVEALRREQAEPERRIGKDELKKAAELLRKYKEGKANLEARVVEDELWWELRHWEVIRRSERGRRVCGCGADGTPGPEPTSAWLFNAIINKHADAMDNYPEPIVLPRERSDEGSAHILSSVLPVVLEQNEFEATYADAWWEKLKHGTAAYGVFWNSEKENGLGDIEVVGLDLLNLFWEPGVTDIQKSANLFITELQDVEELERQYPEFQGKFGDAVEVKEYVYDDSVDNSDKRVVVDWYYKVRTPGGRTVVHYVKFCGDCLLYASENEDAYRERGYYDHGMYPVVLDVLFPEKGTPAGFGYVAVCKDPQLYIDKLSAGILENTMQASKKRFFVSSSTGVNEDEFLDWNKPLVRVEGELGDARIQEISVSGIGSLPVEVMQMKIDEMKETAANRDVSSGGTRGGVTAASAITALQEAGNKVSRDMISASYRAFTGVARQCIELMRQFYDEERTFRVTGQSGEYQFVEFSNRNIQAQPTGVGADGGELIRVPVFDLKIKAQKSNPFSRIEQNSRAQELYGAGFFEPEKAQASLIALEMMDFEGIEAVREKVRNGQTLLKLLQEAQQQLQQLRQQMQQQERMFGQQLQQQEQEAQRLREIVGRMMDGGDGAVQGARNAPHPSAPLRGTGAATFSPMGGRQRPTAFGGEQVHGGGGRSVDARRAQGVRQAMQPPRPMQERLARQAVPRIGG